MGKSLDSNGRIWEDTGMSNALPAYQFGLRKMLLWTAMVALYCGLVVAVESENIEWLVLCCCPPLILGIRLAFGSWIACHVSAFAAGGVLALRTFSPALPASAMEVWIAFVQGCGAGYAVWLVVELACVLVNRVDRLMRSK